MEWKFNIRKENLIVFLLWLRAPKKNVDFNASQFLWPPDIVLMQSFAHYVFSQVYFSGPWVNI